MKIVVFGGGDGTCCRLIEKALPDHQVTVLCPNDLPFTKHHENLNIICGCIEDPKALALALRGQDAVVTALSSSHPSDETETIIRAMNCTGVRRFIAITPPKKKTRSLYSKLLTWFSKKRSTDLSTIEWLMKKSGLKWTIVCPPALTNSPPTGAYHLAHEPQGEISSHDLANFMLDELSSTEHVGKVVGLAT